MRTVTYQQWHEEGVRRFGDDALDWRFVCPSCGHVASVRDWKNVGASQGEIAFSCVGRHTEGAHEAFDKSSGPGPCTYAGGGLFRLNPVEVTRPDGKPTCVFEFADPTPERAP